ncbi:MAG: tetraacyldisaccharide 4'-kinase [Deltaproteobacteria bacterium]|jgi:tetraacyldisaccharide 4'-kinase|nr:tetraacyldisaccharide 4'-kinase [Deltaproteobacteria bacterium]
MEYRQLRKILAPVLIPASQGYAAFLRLRSRLFARGVKSSVKPEAFCISVGNISWGGSGKTPLVSWLLHWAHKHSLAPVVLTRGYGGKSSWRPLPVQAATDPAVSGDEPLMLAKMHPRALILADPDRRRALRWAGEHYSPGLYILDDGMQHLALQRDLNLVVLREEDLGAEWNKVIPAGSWREDKSALARAGAFLLRLPPDADMSGSGVQRFLDNAAKKMAEFNVPLFSFQLKALGLIPLRDWPEGAVQDMSGRTYALCTAVGNPESVRAGAGYLTGGPPAREFFFPDHHRFSLEDLKKIAGTKLPVIITAKDAVKIQLLRRELPGAEILVLHSAVEFGSTRLLKPGGGFEDWLDARFAAYCHAGTEGF